MKPILPASLAKFRDDLGPVGVASLALLAAALAFLFLSVKPLEARNSLLEEELTRAQQRGSAASASATPAERMAEFYAFFEQAQQLLPGQPQDPKAQPARQAPDSTDWLARLHALARDAGVDLRSAQYQMSSTGTPASMGRYEITLPLTGSYAQIRNFLEKALAEIPVLSLDQVNFRRKSPNDSVIQADVRLSLHMVKP